MTATDAHRVVYDLLVNRFPAGLTREQLQHHSGLPDRRMRKVIEEVRTLAATHPHPKLGRPVVIGFDPEAERYVAAQTAAQAKRIVRYYAARLEPIAATVRLQNQAAAAYKPEAPRQERLLSDGRNRLAGQP